MEKHKQSYPKASAPQTGQQLDEGWSMCTISFGGSCRAEALIKCPSVVALRSEEGRPFESSRENQGNN